MNKAIFILSLILSGLVVVLLTTVLSIDFDLCMPFTGVEHNGDLFSGRVGWCD